jgi:hypothetical protein
MAALSPRDGRLRFDSGPVRALALPPLRATTGLKQRSKDQDCWELEPNLVPEQLRDLGSEARHSSQSSQSLYRFPSGVGSSEQRREELRPGHRNGQMVGIAQVEARNAPHLELIGAKTGPNGFPDSGAPSACVAASPLIERGQARAAARATPATNAATVALPALLQCSPATGEMLCLLCRRIEGPVTRSRLNVARGFLRL